MSMVVMLLRFVCQKDITVKTASKYMILQKQDTNKEIPNNYKKIDG